MKIGDADEHARLLELLEKIKVLLKEYDVAAIINVQGKQQAEWILEVAPTWGCMSIEKAEDGTEYIRFRAAIKTGGPEERERARLSSGIIMGFLDVNRKHSELLTQLAHMLGRHLTIEHIGIEGAPPEQEPPQRNRLE
jgi:hypothetical protein